MWDLRLGDRGPQVELLQLGLGRAGYLSAPPDGAFGPVTEAALRRFQRAGGLAADGIAGPRTRAALEPWLTGFVTHTLRRGETLFLLARRYGASLAALDAANPGLDPLRLRPGQRIAVPLPFPVVPGTVSFTSELLSCCVRGLTARYPFLETESVGESVLGSPLTLLRLGSGEKRVFVNGAHHANEWLTAPLLLRYLEEAAEALAFGRPLHGADAAALFRRVTLELLPLVNPDGVDLVTGLLAPDAAVRRLAANYPAIPFPAGWKANIRGVDPNLQYPAGWQEARRIKFAQGYTRPGPRDFVGDGPLTEPEPLALYRLTRRRNYALTLSFHSQGEVIYWKYLDFEPAHSRAIGEELARVSGYSLELTPAASSYAGYKDWFIQDFDRPGYTVEIGSGENPLPLSQLGPAYAACAPLVTRALELTAELL